MILDQGIILATAEVPPNAGVVPGGLGAASVTLALDITGTHASVPGRIMGDVLSDMELVIDITTSFVAAEPTTDAERTEVAAACQVNLDLRMPMLIDRIDNDIDDKYVGLPMRLFLVDAAGKIAFAGEKGPFGWDDEAFEAALKEAIA